MTSQPFFLLVAILYSVLRCAICILLVSIVFCLCLKAISFRPILLYSLITALYSLCYCNRLCSSTAWLIQRYCTALAVMLHDACSDTAQQGE